MESDEDDNIVIQDIYDAISYHMKRLISETPIIIKRGYFKIPEKQRGLLERNSSVIMALLFLLIYGLLFYLFSFFGIITQLIIKLLSYAFDISETVIYSNFMIFLGGESLLQQWYHPEEVICEILLAILFMFYSFGIFFFIVIYFVKRISRKDLSYVGFKNPLGDKGGIIFVLLFSCSQIAALSILPSILRTLLSNLEGDFSWLNEMARPALNLDIALRPVYSFIGIDFLIAIFIPLLYILMIAISEEVTFRGIIQTTLVERIGKYKGLLFTSIIFTLGHMQYLNEPTGLFSVFMGSLLYGYLYLRKKNLFSPIILHFLHNFILWSFSI